MRTRGASWARRQEVLRVQGGPGVVVSGLLITLFALVLVVDRAKDRTLEHLRRIQRALVRARDQAAEASQSKSDFMARVSHEVRTPMTAILGFSELLLERLRRADPVRESVTTIRRDARHLLDVINDILDLSRIEDGRLDIVERDCDPGAIAREVIRSLQMRAREGDVSLDVQLEPVVPQRIRADPRRFRQVLLCLVGNAIQFSGGGTVWVRLSCTDCGSEPRLCFEIRDAGIGMLPEQLDRLFEPFVQGDSSARRRFGGTGLGLSIAKRLCERMGGSIEARSELGVGSRFRVVLPLEPPGADAASAEVEADPGEAPIPALDGGPRVLFADDVRDNRRLLGEVLERARRFAKLGERRSRPRGSSASTSWCSIWRCRASAVSRSRALRAQGYSGPLIALTARALHGDEERQLGTCFGVVVAKPFERRDLLGAIAQARQGRGAAGVREAPARPARRAAQARGGAGSAGSAGCGASCHRVSGKTPRSCTAHGSSSAWGSCRFRCDAGLGGAAPRHPATAHGRGVRRPARARGPHGARHSLAAAQVRVSRDRGPRAARVQLRVRGPAHRVHGRRGLTGELLGDDPGDRGSASRRAARHRGLGGLRPRTPIDRPELLRLVAHYRALRKLDEEGAGIGG